MRYQATQLAILANDVGDLFDDHLSGIRQRISHYNGHRNATIIMNYSLLLLFLFTTLTVESPWSAQMEYIKSLKTTLGLASPGSNRQIPPTRTPHPKHTKRCSILDDTVTVFGYPSRGGLIVLERADAIDFDFLEISRLDPPLTRAAAPAAEDEFCQRLLLLGAKWFDSESRYRFMTGLREHSHACERDLETRKTPELVLGERQWVKVGWPTKAGGFWVGEWDTNLPYILEDQLVPINAAKVTLAMNMDERCEILKGMGAKFYKSVAEYDGHAYLKAWQTKWQGDVEPLQQTWPELFCFHPSVTCEQKEVGRLKEGRRGLFRSLALA